MFFSLHLRFLVEDAGEGDGCFTTDGLSFCLCFLVEGEETGGGLSVEIHNYKLEMFNAYIMYLLATITERT